MTSSRLILILTFWGLSLLVQSSCSEVQTEIPQAQNSDLEALSTHHPVIPILVFHFKTDKDGGYPHLASTFDLFKTYGYTTVSLAQLEAFYYKEKPLPQKPILLAIVAGYRQAYKAFDPLLKQHAMRASMFILTEKLKKADHHFICWRDAKKMVKEGSWDVGLNGHRTFDTVTIDRDGNEGFFLTHRKWISASKGRESLEIYKERVHNDFETSTQEFREKLTSSPMAFAFPYGNSGETATEKTDIQDFLIGETSQFPLVISQYGNGYNDLHSNPKRLNGMVVDPRLKPMDLLTKLENFQPRSTMNPMDTGREWRSSEWETNGQLFKKYGRLEFSTFPDQLGASAWVSGTQTWKDLKVELKLAGPVEGQVWVVTHDHPKIGIVRVGVVSGQLLVQQLLKGEVRYHNLIRPKKVGLSLISRGVSITVIHNRLHVSWGDDPASKITTKTDVPIRQGRLALAIWSDQPGKVKVLADRVSVKRLLPRWLIVPELTPQIVEKTRKDGDDVLALSPKWFEVKEGILNGPFASLSTLSLITKLGNVPVLPTVILKDFHHAVPGAITPAQLIESLEKVGAQGVHLYITEEASSSKSFLSFLREVSSLAKDRLWIVGLSLESADKSFPSKESCEIVDACLASQPISLPELSTLNQTEPLTRLWDKLFLFVQGQSDSETGPPTQIKSALDQFRGFVFKGV